MKKLISRWGIWVILILALVVRLYRLDRPLADWHSWRQADTASVTREYVKHGIDLLHPTYHDLSNIPSGLDNLTGYRMVEFPLINAVTAVAFNLTGGWGLELHVFSRLVSILFSLGAIYALYQVVAHFYTTRTALISASVFALLPYNIFFHTTVLPEVPLVFFTLASVWMWLKWCQTRSLPSLLIFIITATISMLLKPLLIFIVPALLCYLYHTQGWSGFKNWRNYVAAVLVLAPILLWRYWITQFPEGIPASSWLFNGNGIRFKGAWFRWLFADRVGRLIMGYWGVVPLALGIVIKPSKTAGWFFHYYLLGALGYLAVFATGNVTHDYYQIFIIPILAIFMGLGLEYLLTHKNKDWSLLMSRTVALTITAFTLAFGWFHVRDYFNINNPAIVDAGQAVDRLTESDALIIAPYMGDTAFLYQTNRRGWPIGGQIEERIDQGATYYISTSYDDEARALEVACEMIDKTEQYILISLNNCALPLP